MIGPDDCPDFVDSDIDIPRIMPSDPNPHGTLDSIGGVAFAGIGTGGEFLSAEGDVYTRAKTDGSGGVVSGGPVDGGTP